MYLQGTQNERDLGGMVTEDGRRIRKGLFLRTDALDKLTDDDVRLLRNGYKLTTIIDMRNEEERCEKPDRIVEGAQYCHFPLFITSQAGITREEEQLKMIDGIPDMVMLYKLVVSSDTVSEKLGNALKTVIRNEKDGRQQCTLFHCVAGKDRTGILAMLILGILGVSEEDIMEDYLLTNVTGIAIANAIARQVEQETGNADMAERVRAAYTADASFLQSAMDYIHDKYGTIRNYCRDKLHVSEEEMDAFCERVLEPAN